METHYTESTTQYWQIFQDENDVQLKPPWKYGCPVRLPNGRFLILPIRQLPGNSYHAVASLLVNAASLEVVDSLASMLATRIEPYKPDLIIGLPTLGHVLCPGVARGLGHTRYVPLGYSQKFWYKYDLSTSVSSITSPEIGQKRLWIDPHQLPLLKDRRIAIVDDAISSGTTMLAAWKLLESLGVKVVVCGVVMMQGSNWKEIIGEHRISKVVGVFESPLLEATSGGWTYRS